MTELALRMAAIGAAVAPAALLLIYVVARDGGRSSAALIGLALSFGAIAGLPAGALSMSLDASGAFGGSSNIHMQGFIRALLFAAAPEELAKFVMLIGIVARHEDCVRPTDILVGSIAIALGFAVLEGCFYIVSSDDWSQTAITRAASATPGHFFNGVLMGVFVSGMADLGAHWKNYLAGLMAAILAHTLYDVPLFSFQLSPSEERTEAVVVILAALFMVTLTITSIIALRYLRLLRPDDGVTLDSRWLRILMLHHTWRIMGAALIGSAFAALAAVAASLFDGHYEKAVFIPFVIVPVAVGWSMVRFARERAGRRMVLPVS